MERYKFIFLLTLLVNITSVEIKADVFGYDIAIEDSEGKYMYYNYIENGTELEVTDGLFAYTGNIIIPESLIYDNKALTVTRIGDKAFYYNDIEMITIPNTVRSIGNEAFSHCARLASVSLPNSITVIGDRAFYGCSGLTSVTLPNSLTSIGYIAFQGCRNLSSIISLMENPVEIKGKLLDSTFSSDVYENATLLVPTGLESLYELSLGWWDFVYIDEYKEMVSVPNSDGVLISYYLNNDGTELGVKANGKKYCGKLIIPEEVEYKNQKFKVTSIEKKAFYGCHDLLSITIPNTVKNIGRLAFYDCSSLESIILGNSISAVDNSAFHECNSLTSVHISEIEAWCNISFGNKESNPLYYAHHLYLNEEEVKNLIIPNTITSISPFAFYNCSDISSVFVPNSVNKIGGDAFEGCVSITSVHISDKDAWCDISFNNRKSNPLCYAHHLFLNEEEIKDYIIPNNIKRISPYAFYCCTGLTSITIPQSVIEIGYCAFKGCSSLFSVTSMIEDPTIMLTNPIPVNYSDDDIGYFPSETYNNGTLYVPINTKQNYMVTRDWGYFVNIEEFEPDGISNVYSHELIRSFNGDILINSAVDGTPIIVYSTSGEEICKDVIRGGKVCLYTGLKPGSIVIVKIGVRTVKCIVN
jgi:hypothetical protein